jgi:hypothetical protein
MAEQWTSDDFRDSLQSMEAHWAGAILRAIQSLKLEEEVSDEPIYGNDSIAIGLPKGTHKATGELVTIPSEADAIYEQLGNQWTQVPGSIGVTLRRPNGTSYNVDLTRVYLRKTSIEFGKAGGSDPSLKTLSLRILDPVNWNGLRGIEAPGDAFAFPVPIFSF